VTTLDWLDRQIVTRRTDTLNEIRGPRVGDWVDFVNGERQRIAYIIWPNGGVQTSDTGLYYLGYDAVIHSGNRYPTALPPDALTLTEETGMGDVWVLSS
jgi:hypothetical protein